MTRNESVTAFAGCIIVSLVTMWYITGMMRLQNAITLNVAPGDVGTVVVSVYLALETVFGRYYLDTFIILSSIVFWLGSCQAIITLGETTWVLVKGGVSLIVTQFFISGWEMIKIIENQWPIPTDMSGNMLNIVGQVWLYPVEWFGITMSLAILGGLAIIAVCCLSMFVLGYDLYGHRMEPVVNRIQIAVKKKIPPLTLPAWADRVRGQRTEAIETTDPMPLIQETVDPISRPPQRIGITSNQEVPVLTDIVTATVMPAPPKVTEPVRLVAKAAPPKKALQVVKAVSPKPVTQLPNPSKGDVIEDKIRDGLITLGLGFTDLNRHDGIFTTRFTMSPTSAVIGQQETWRKAEGEIARLMGVGQNDVTFEVQDSHYVYVVNKPSDARGTVLFKELIKGSIASIPKGVELPVLLGTDVGANRVIKCGFKLQDLLIVGRKGSGKSSLLHSILIYQMLWSIKTKRLKLAYYISDINGATAMKYAPLKDSFIQGTATSHLESVKMLEKLANELQNRVALLQKYQCQHITTVNAKLAKEGKDTLPIIFIVLEEVGALFNDKGTRERLGSIIASIVTTGRKYGIFFYSVGTFAMKGIFGASGSRLIEESTKLSFLLNSPKDAYTFGGANFPANKLIETGDALLRDTGDKVTRLHTPVFSRNHTDNDGLIDRYIGHIKSEISKCKA